MGDSTGRLWAKVYQTSNGKEFLDKPANPERKGEVKITDLAAHTARHTPQIEEVKADAGFPSE